MQRRRFIQGVAALSTAAMFPISFAKQQPDVIVLGAGLSGLAAAHNLKNAGLNVLVLEADNRIGGRIKTLDNVITRPEAGGLQVGKGYGYMRTLAQQLNVPLEPLTGFARGNAFLIDQHLLSAEQWPTHLVNKLNKEEKSIPPSQLYFHYLKKMPKLGLAANWNQPKFAHLDISMASMLKQLGASEQAMQLMNANVNANSLDTLSAADAIHSFTQLMNGGRASDKAVGGNSRFIEALSQNLQGDILLDKKVSKISSELSSAKGSVSVICSDGSVYRAEHCICTIPFSVMRGIDLQAPISAAQQSAISELNYTAITQVHFEVTDDSWLDDGLPANIWSDGEVGRVFASKDAEGRVKHLVSWINGDSAKLLDQLPANQAMQHIHASLIKHRPSMQGKIKPVYLQSWGNNPYSLGAYSSFAPGQVQAFAGKMAASAGNLHFAGEHTNHAYSGMESALVSGINAAGKVLDTG